MQKAYLTKDIFSGGKDKVLRGKRGLLVEVVSVRGKVLIVRQPGADRGFSVLETEISMQ